MKSALQLSRCVIWARRTLSVICTVTGVYTSLAKHCWKKPSVRALAHLEGHTSAFYIGFSVNPTRIKHCKTYVEAQQTNEPVQL